MRFLYGMRYWGVQPQFVIPRECGHPANTSGADKPGLRLLDRLLEPLIGPRFASARWRATTTVGMVPPSRYHQRDECIFPSACTGPKPFHAAGAGIEHRGSDVQGTRQRSTAGGQARP